MVDYRDLGKRVRKLRRQMHLTQDQLAEQLGLSASFLGHIERGTRAASLETVIALCKALHTSPSYLLSASLDNEPSPTSDTPEFNRTRFEELLRMAQSALDYLDD